MQWDALAAEVKDLIALQARAGADNAPRTSLSPTSIRHLLDSFVFGPGAKDGGEVVACAAIAG
jgi:hypothetical protein